MCREIYTPGYGDTDTATTARPDLKGGGRFPESLHPEGSSLPDRRCDPRRMNTGVATALPSGRVIGIEHGEVPAPEIWFPGL